MYLRDLLNRLVEEFEELKYQYDQLEFIVQSSIEKLEKERNKNNA
jgi:hypothetical protein